MDIKIKYDLGQSVFYMRDNRVQNGSVSRIVIEIDCYGSDENIRVRTGYNVTYDSPLYRETELFLTKEELLKSL